MHYELLKFRPTTLSVETGGFVSGGSLRGGTELGVTWPLTLKHFDAGRRSRPPGKTGDLWTPRSASSSWNLSALSSLHQNLDPFVALWSMCNALRRDRLPDRASYLQRLRRAQASECDMSRQCSCWTAFIQRGCRRGHRSHSRCAIRHGDKEDDMNVTLEGSVLWGLSYFFWRRLEAK
jgi:hypothetical protein